MSIFVLIPTNKQCFDFTRKVEVTNLVLYFLANENVKNWEKFEN